MDFFSVVAHILPQGKVLSCSFIHLRTWLVLCLSSLICKWRLSTKVRLAQLWHVSYGVVPSRLMGGFVALRDFSELCLELCNVRYVGNRTQFTAQPSDRKGHDAWFPHHLTSSVSKKLLCKSKLITTQWVYISALIGIRCELFKEISWLSPLTAFTWRGALRKDNLASYGWNYPGRQT